MSLVNNVIDKLSEYIRVKGEMLKLEVISRASKLIAYAISFFLIAVVGVFFLIFLSITAGAFLNEWLNSVFLGYLIITGFYLTLLVLILILLKTGSLSRWIENLLLKLNEDENEQAD